MRLLAVAAVAFLVLGSALGYGAGGYQTREKGIFVYVTRRLGPGKEPLEIAWVLVTGPEDLVDYGL